MPYYGDEARPIGKADVAQVKARLLMVGGQSAVDDGLCLDRWATIVDKALAAGITKPQIVAELALTADGQRLVDTMLACQANHNENPPTGRIQGSPPTPAKSIPITQTDIDA